MNPISRKLGIWSASMLTLAFAAWIVCFVGIAATSPLFQWTNLGDYLTFEKANSQVFQYTAKFFMMLFGPLFMILINSYYDYAPDNKKVLVRLSLLFAAAFAILSSLHYFVQLSSVRINIEQGNTVGLENFVQANPNSIMTAIDMLGWTLFLGLSSLFIFTVFEGDRLKRIIRYGFLVNGISCLLGGVGYMFKIDVLTFLCMNLILGGAVLTVSIASLMMFRRTKQI
jgi:hypothetical protein